MGNPITLSLVVLMVVSWRSYRQVTRVVEEPQGCCNQALKKPKAILHWHLLLNGEPVCYAACSGCYNSFPFLLTSVASGYEMTRRDRLGVLYSNQVVFDKRGEPLVSVRITEGQKKVEFSSTKRIVLMPGGDDGSLFGRPHEPSGR